MRWSSFLLFPACQTEGLCLPDGGVSPAGLSTAGSRMTPDAEPFKALEAS